MEFTIKDTKIAFLVISMLVLLLTGCSSEPDDAEILPDYKKEMIDQLCAENPNWDCSDY